jgi:BMFP domain-containing protein YqiC
MVERPKMFDDFAGMAGGALSAMSGLREELTALIRARADEVIRSLDLVRREEFDAVMALATNAKTEAEHLAARVAALEAKAAPASVYEEAVVSDGDMAAAPALDTKSDTKQETDPMPDMSSAHPFTPETPKAPETPHDS